MANMEFPLDEADQYRYPILKKWFEDHNGDDPIYTLHPSEFDAAVKEWARQSFGDENVGLNAMAVTTYSIVFKHNLKMWQANRSLFDRAMAFIEGLGNGKGYR
jgi:hypothetical protein